MDDLFRRLEALRERFPDDAQIALEEAQVLLKHGLALAAHGQKVFATLQMQAGLRLAMQYVGMWDNPLREGFLWILEHYFDLCQESGVEPDAALLEAKQNTGRGNLFSNV